MKMFYEISMAIMLITIMGITIFNFIRKDYTVAIIGLIVLIVNLYLIRW